MIKDPRFSLVSSLSIIALLGIAGILLFIVGGIFSGWPLYIEDEKGNDVANWVTLTSEIGVGILIAIIIYIITIYHQQESRNILNRLDLSLKLREIRVLSQISGNMKFIVRMLDNIQYEIDNKKGVLDSASDKRMAGYRDVVRDLCKNLRQTNITDLPSLEIDRQLNSVLIGLEIYVDHWDKTWDVIKSDIYNDIDILLEMLISHANSLGSKK